MSNLTNTLQAHLQAAEADGRPLTDGEASLIESLANVSAQPVVDVEARAAIENLRADVEAARPARATQPRTVFASMLPNADGMAALLHGIQTRQPVSVQASYYDVQKPVDTVAGAPVRLSDRLPNYGATLAPIARKLEVPRIASGDAAAWTYPGTKAEIVTELAQIEADILAAWTEVTSLNLVDLPSLEMQIGTLLGRRVVVQENAALAESLLAQGTAGAGAASPVDVVVDAIVTATGSGNGPNFLLLSQSIATGVMANAQSGYAGLDDYWRGTLFGLPFHVVPGMTAGTALAADASALVIGRTAVLQLVDPYSGSKTNSVILRTESSLAVAALDPHAVGTSALLD